MRQAIEMAGRLNEQIRSSQEYRRYVETDRRLREDPELYGQYNAFRRRNYELQFSQGDSNLYDEICGLVKEYEGVLQDSRVNDFTLAERRLCAMLREMYAALSEGLELDYEYLEK